MLELRGKCDLRAIALGLSNILRETKKVAIVTDDTAFRRVANTVESSNRVLESEGIYIVVVPELMVADDTEYVSKLIETAKEDLSYATGETFDDIILVWQGKDGVKLDCNTSSIEMYKTGIIKNEEYSWETVDDNVDADNFVLFSNKKIHAKANVHGARKVLLEKEDICAIYTDEELGRFKLRSNNWTSIAKYLAKRYYDASDKLLKKW